MDGKRNRTYKRDNPYLVLPLDGDGEMLEEGPAPLDPEKEVVSRLTVLEITSLLTPQERRLVELRYLGFTQKEIAAIEGVGYKAVQKRLGRVKAKVRIALPGEDALA